MKVWKKGEIIKEEYLKAKRHAECIVYKVKKSVEDEKFDDVKQNGNNTLKMAKRIWKNNKMLLISYLCYLYQR